VALGLLQRVALGDLEIIPYFHQLHLLGEVGVEVNHRLGPMVVQEVVVLGLVLVVLETHLQQVPPKEIMVVQALRPPIIQRGVAVVPVVLVEILLEQLLVLEALELQTQ